VKQKKKQKLSPLEAKSKQKHYIRQNKKSKKTDSKLTDLLVAEQEERDVMMDARQKRMRFELDQHNDMKKIEGSKIRIDEKRLDMEHSTFELKREQLKFQTDYEKNCVLLQKMELFKKREELKSQNPNLTDEFLDRLFPL
jgi:hypothetical protein